MKRYVGSDVHPWMMRPSNPENRRKTPKNPLACEDPVISVMGPYVRAQKVPEPAIFLPARGPASLPLSRPPAKGIEPQGRRLRHNSDRCFHRAFHSRTFSRKSPETPVNFFLDIVVCLLYIVYNYSLIFYSLPGLARTNAKSETGNQYSKP